MVIVAFRPGHPASAPWSLWPRARTVAEALAARSSLLTAGYHAHAFERDSIAHLTQTHERFAGAKQVDRLPVPVTMATLEQHIQHFGTPAERRRMNAKRPPLQTLFGG